MIGTYKPEGCEVNHYIFEVLSGVRVASISALTTYIMLAHVTEQSALQLSW